MAAGQANLIIPPVARGYARYVLALMVGINLLNYMDRWVAASAGPLIEKELGISDSLFGLLGTAFLLVYAIAAVPFGYWGDRGVRKTVIGVGVTIWSIATLFTVFASNAFWLPTVLQRRFEMTAGRAGLLAGVVIVVGGLIGTLAGGWLADRRALATPKAHLEVGIIGFLAGAVLITVAILSPLNIGPIPVFIPVFLLTVICLYLYAGPFTAVSQNVVSPGLRASAVTLLLFVAHVFGDSHSTFDIGLLSDRLGGNLQLALVISSPTLLILAAIAAATGLRTIKRDTEAMEEDWAARTGDPALTRA